MPLTDAGRFLFPQARSLVADADRLPADTPSSGAEAAGALRVGHSGNLCGSAYSKLLRPLLDTYPAWSPPSARWPGSEGTRSRPRRSGDAGFAVQSSLDHQPACSCTGQRDGTAPTGGFRWQLSAAPGEFRTRGGGRRHLPAAPRPRNPGSCHLGLLAVAVGVAALVHSMFAAPPAGRDQRAPLPTSSTSRFGQRSKDAGHDRAHWWCT